MQGHQAVLARLSIAEHRHRRFLSISALFQNCTHTAHTTTRPPRSEDEALFFPETRRRATKRADVYIPRGRTPRASAPSTGTPTPVGHADGRPARLRVVQHEPKIKREENKQEAERSNLANFAHTFAKRGVVVCVSNGLEWQGTVACTRAGPTSVRV